MSLMCVFSYLKTALFSPAGVGSTLSSFLEETLYKNVQYK